MIFVFLLFLLCVPAFGQQWGLPTTDDQHVNWSQGAGDGNSTHFEEVDEGFGSGRGSGSGPDDATTYWLTTTDFAQIRSSLNSVTDPSSSSGHVIRVRRRKSASGGQQQDSINALEQGGTQIAQDNVSNINEVWTTQSYTLTGTQADNITNYGDLHIRTTLDEVGGGSGREYHCSAQELEVPSAGGGGAVVKDVIMEGVIPFPR